MTHHEANGRVDARPSEADQLRRDLAEILLELAKLRQALAAPQRPGAAEQLVTLDQLAAVVNRKKRSLERYRDEMPPARVHGRLGQASLWDWAEVRPWLQRAFGRDLPERFPGMG